MRVESSVMMALHSPFELELYPIPSTNYFRLPEFQPTAYQVAVYEATGLQMGKLASVEN